MALNISRGKYQNKYSSDRISSLIGNGLLVFLNKKTQFQKILTSKEVVYFKNKKDLINKIIFYNDNDKARIKIAKSGYFKYHKFMNNKLITKYIMSCVKLEKIKRRSKFLLFFFNKNIVMLVHLGMTGKFFFVDQKKIKYKTKNIKHYLLCFCIFRSFF